MFFKVSESGDLRHIVIKGRSLNGAQEAWESIVAKSQQVSGDHEYQIVLDEYKGLAELVNEYNTVRVALSMLLYKVDYDLVALVGEYGIEIDTTSSESYKNSLYKAIKDSVNYQTLIQIQKKQLESEGKSTAPTKVTYEQLIAGLTMVLKFNVPSDITLALYNEYTKQIRSHGRRTDKEE